MLIFSILFLLLSNTVTLRRDKLILYSRVTITVLLYSSPLALGSLYLTNLDTRIGLFGGLFHATSITQVFRTFKFLIYTCICVFFATLTLIYSFALSDILIYAFYFDLSLFESYDLIFNNQGNNCEGYVCCDGTGGSGGSGGYGGYGGYGGSGGNPNPNNGGPGPGSDNHILPFDTDTETETEDDRRLKQWMLNKLNKHRIDQASSKPYTTEMGDHFRPEEHEYIADLITKQAKDGDKSMNCFLKKIEGKCPDRRYTGQITYRFLDKFFS